jgi:hypothetical protein
MIEYTTKLRKEIDELIDKIESSESNILKKSIEASHVLAGVQIPAKVCTRTDLNCAGILRGQKHEPFLLF